MRYLKQCLQAPPHSLSPVLTRFLALFFDPFSPLSWSLEQVIVIDGHSPYLQHFTYLIVVIYTLSPQYHVFSILLRQKIL